MQYSAASTIWSGRWTAISDLQLSLKKLGLQHTLEYAALLECMGRAVAERGQLEKALSMFESSLAIRRNLLPPVHPAVAMSYSFIATANAHMGRTGAAAAAHDSYVAVARRSQVYCAGPGCARKLREDGAPLDQCAGCLRTYYVLTWVGPARLLQPTIPT